ncbi:MAG: ferritin family protein [FCB group bacterium]|nr:ferritin family protein [FCB group bacterium]
MELDSVDKVLDFAIQKEQEAADFYTELAKKMKNKAMKDVFDGFAREEMGHKAKLQTVKEGKRLVLAKKAILDLKIGDSLVASEHKEDMSYQDALIVAMKAEKEAFKLYSNLAAVTDDAAMRNLLMGLAQEEAKHKLRFEIEYDEMILTEN